MSVLNASKSFVFNKSQKSTFRTVALIALALGVIYLTATHPAFAGTGSSTQLGQRAGEKTTQFLGILQLMGVAILTAAFMYVGYGMAWGGKKWSDVANVAYGCFIAGVGSLIVGWLFA